MRILFGNCQFLHLQMLKQESQASETLSASGGLCYYYSIQYLSECKSLACV